MVTKICPRSLVSSKLIGLTLVDDILRQFATLKGGILRGVFKQQAACAWYGCRAEKAQVTVLLPGKCCYSKWTELVDCMPHSWSKSFKHWKNADFSLHAASFHKHRKFTRARHMWLRLDPDWKLLRRHLYTDWPGIQTYDEINDRLFVNSGRNENILDAKSKVWRNSPELLAVDGANRLHVAIPGWVGVTCSSQDGKCHC